jgi:hypothetical protein
MQPNEKYCESCKLPGDIKKFDSNGSKECKKCVNKRFLEKLDPEDLKKRRFKYNLNRYGLSLEEALKILNHQNNRCAICLKLISFFWENHDEKACIDHDHEKGKKAVRGILCSNCNTAIGLFKENIENLISAIKYLRFFKPMLVEDFEYCVEDETFSTESDKELNY